MAVSTCDVEASRKKSLDRMKKAIKSVTTSPDFDIPSEKAQKAVMCANKLLEWANKNEDSSTEFAVALTFHLENCINSSKRKEFHKLREVMWERYFKLCSSDEFREAWHTLIGGMVGLQASPIFYQHVTSIIFEDLVKDYFSVPQNNSDNETAKSLSYEECNALRYSIGYVVRALINKLTKSSRIHKEELIMCLRELIVESDINDSPAESSEWTHMIDRGGLYHVDDITFELFVTMELQLRQHLSTFTSNITKDAVLVEILKSDDIFDQWHDISRNWGDESEDLLEMIVEHWITVRGFSHSSSFMELYKKANAKTVQKSKGIRKNLISNN